MNHRVEGFFDKFLPLLIGLAIGIMLVKILANLPVKWGVFIVAGTTLARSLLLSGIMSNRLRGGGRFRAGLALPTFYSNTFFFRENVKFPVLANGFPISLTDVFLLPLIVVWLYKQFFSFEHSRPHFPRDLLVVISLLFAINLISALFVARLPFFSFSMLFLQAKMYLIMFFLANFLRNEHDFRVIGYALAAVLIFEGMVVLEQRFVGVIFTAENLGRATSIRSIIEGGGGTMIRHAGTLAHPNDLAMYINLCLPLVVFMLVMEKIFIRKIVLIAAILLAFAALIGSGSRGGWLGMGVGLAAGIFFWLRKQGKNPFKGMIVMVFSLFLLFSVLFFGSTTFQERLVKGDREAAELRIPLMGVAMEMIKANPVLGVGLNLYTREMVPYDRTNNFVAFNYDQPVHNTFLMVAAESGLPAMVLLSIFVLIIIKETHYVALKGEGIISVIGLGLMCAMVSWFIHNQVNLTTPFGDATLYVLFGTLVAARNFVTRQQQQKLSESGSIRV